MDAETDDLKKWRLENRYSSRQKSLYRDATPVAQALLDMEREGYMQDIEREAYRCFPDDEEKRRRWEANILKFQMSKSLPYGVKIIRHWMRLSKMATLKASSA
ncbi:hypothetical protein M569_17607 [Genlisea aurea]|uniref:Uncharacterized protein n=1 Tax=Genlisea aurea TaxID=192259 RepID=S8D3D8_9LAMI|nr:hypothetical protein M569_17607 [Genlisea aurea]